MPRLTAPGRNVSKVVAVTEGERDLDTRPHFKMNYWKLGGKKTREKDKIRLGIESIYKNQPTKEHKT